MVALGQVTAIMANQLLGLPLPITAVMVLWANLVVASTCTVPLGIEPKHDDVLTDPPRPRGEDIIDRESLVRIIAGSALKASGMLTVFLWTLNSSSLGYAQVVTFMTLVAFEWFQALGNRSWRKSLFELGLFTNRALLVGIGIGVALQWLAVSSPFTERVLGTAPIGIAEWGLALAVGSTGLLLSETITVLYRRKRRSREQLVA
jgi:P-type Ca2+ transporter type 2C